jgi:hypothetical protein
MQKKESSDFLEKMCRIEDSIKQNAEMKAVTIIEEARI